MVQSLRPDWGSVARYPSSGCLVINRAVDWEMGCRVVALVVAGGDMPHYIKITIAFMNWLITPHVFLFLFFFTNKCYPNIEVAMCYHVWVEIWDQLKSADFQSLKHMYYIHVIMIIKWFWLRRGGSMILEIYIKHSRPARNLIVNSCVDSIMWTLV